MAVDLRAQFGAQGPDLPIQEPRNPSSRNCCQRPNVAVTAAPENGRQRPARARIDRPRQDDSDRQRKSGPIGLDPDARDQFVDHAGAADVVGDVDIGPAVGLDLPPFAGFSRVSVALGPLPPQDAVLGIAAGLAQDGWPVSKPSCHAWASPQCASSRLPAAAARAANSNAPAVRVRQRGMGQFSFCFGKSFVAFRSAKVARKLRCFRGAKGDDPTNIAFRNRYNLAFIAADAAVGQSHLGRRGPLGRQAGFRASRGRRESRADAETSPC